MKSIFSATAALALIRPPVDCFTGAAACHDPGPCVQHGPRVARTSDAINRKLILEDENGRKATVTTADVDQSNGVVHVIDLVLLPAGQAG